MATWRRSYTTHMDTNRTIIHTLDEITDPRQSSPVEYSTGEHVLPLNIQRENFQPFPHVGARL